MTRLGDIAEIQAGLVTKSAEESRGVPVLTMASLAALRAGSLLENDLPLMEEELSMREARYRLEAGDILVPSRTTEGYLQPTMTEGGVEEGKVFNATLLRVRVTSDKVIPGWLFSYLSSESGKASLLQGSQSRATQLSLGAKLIESVEIEIPPMDEQMKVWQLIENAHSAKRNAVKAADVRIKLAYAVAFQTSGKK